MFLISRAEIKPPALKMWLDQQDGVPKTINKGLCHLYKEDPILKEVKDDSWRIGKGSAIQGNGDHTEVHWKGRKYVAGVPQGNKVGAMLVVVVNRKDTCYYCLNVD
jgi:hypothetical protein